MDTEQSKIKSTEQALTIPVVTTRFSFSGWADVNFHNPKKNGEYLCLIKWYDSSEYRYSILEYNKKTKWQVTDSCDHILWSKLPPSPFS